MSNLIKEFIDADLECLLPVNIEEYLKDRVMYEDSLNNEKDSLEDYCFEFHHSRLYDEYEPDVFEMAGDTYFDDYDEEDEVGEDQNL